MTSNLRERLMSLMFETLYHEGYHASNLNAMLKKAGTSKGGLYHHFSSKKELALTTLKEVGEAFIHRYWNTPLQTDAHPIDTLGMQCHNLPGTPIFGTCHVDVTYGCPINNAIQELSAVDEEFRSLLASIMEQWQQVIASALTRAQTQGTLQPRVDATATARFIVASIEGAFTLAKVTQNEADYYEATAQLHHLLQSLKTPEATPCPQ